MALKPLIGASNFVYALLNESTDVSGGTPTWGTIYPIPGLRVASIDPQPSASVLYADDGPSVMAETIGAVKFSLEFADLTNEDYARLLGHTYANGVVTENPADQSPYVALGFKALRSGGNYSYYWFYKGRFMKPKTDLKTKADKVEFASPKLEAQFVQLISNSALSVQARDDDTNFLGAATWFSAVQLPSMDNGAISVVGSYSTNTFVFTFSKVGSGPFTIPAEYLTDQWFKVIKEADDSLLVPTSIVWNTPAKTVTFTPNSTPASGTYYVVANKGIKDSWGIALAANYLLEVTKP